MESFNAAVSAVRKRAELPADCPVWFTGWSTGPGSYAVKDLAAKLRGVRLVQFAGEHDVLDDTEWIKSIPAEVPHKLVEIPGVSHDMGGAGDRFMAEFDMAIQWTLDTPISK